LEGGAKEKEYLEKKCFKIRGKKEKKSEGRIAERCGKKRK